MRYRTILPVDIRSRRCHERCLDKGCAIELSCPLIYEGEGVMKDASTKDALSNYPARWSTREKHVVRCCNRLAVRNSVT